MDEIRTEPLTDRNETHESNQTLWLLAGSPLVWAAHFLASYLTAAVWCEKVAGRGGSLWGARMAIVVYTLVAIAAIAAIGWSGYRRHSYGTATVPHDYDSPEDRHRFLGFATVLLSGISMVATLYVALAAFYLETCN